MWGPRTSRIACLLGTLALVALGCTADNPAYLAVVGSDADEPAPAADGAARDTTLAADRAPEPDAPVAPPDGSPPGKDAALPDQPTPDAAGKDAPAPDTAPPPGLALVAHYKMDEGIGARLVDSSGNANDVTLKTAGAWVVGRMATGLDLGATGPISVPSSASLDSTSTGITIAAWVQRRAQTKGWASIVSRQYQGTDEEYYTLALRDDVPAFETQYNVIIMAPAAIAQNTWVHIAATYDGKTQILYVSGKPAISSTATRKLEATKNPLIIGGNQNEGTTTIEEQFGGYVDDVRIYARVLSAAEIAALAAP